MAAHTLLAIKVDPETGQLGVGINEDLPNSIFFMLVSMVVVTFMRKSGLSAPMTLLRLASELRKLENNEGFIKHARQVTVDASVEEGDPFEAGFAKGVEELEKPEHEIPESPKSPPNWFTQGWNNNLN